MKVDVYSVLLAISASVLSGFGTAIISSIKEAKREKIRQHERDQDKLKLELKDLKIQLYQLERDLIEWKDKYYEAIQELIVVKSELEDTLIRLNHVDLHK